VRPQQQRILKALLDSESEGTVNARADFLTLADFLECVRQSSELMAASEKPISRNTAQHWLRSGLLRDSGKPEREARNRLFSITDVIRLLTVRIL
jgi:hypothetical protein